MLHWDQDSGEIVERIMRAQMPFKILLKTADDPILLPIWLEHYLAFMPPSGIVIADNMSTDAGVLAIYADLPSGVLVFQYDDQPTHGFHNVIHDRITYAPLYEALRQSCSHSLFIDTDELLLVTDGHRWEANHAAILAVLDRHSGQAVPTVWLQAIRGSVDSAYIGTNRNSLASGIAWGKPFVPTSFAGAGFLIHNAQFPRTLFGPTVTPELALLHLADYSVAQRLESNRKKLAARRFIDPLSHYEDISRMDTACSRDPTVVRLVNEVKALLARRNEGATYPELPGGCLQFQSSGTVLFSDVPTRRSYFRFSRDASLIFDRQHRKVAGASAPRPMKEAGMKPHMTDAEVSLFKAQLHGCRLLLEFGCGGSTVFAAHSGVTVITSIDSDKVWLDNVAATPEVAAIQFTPVFVDIGQTGAWGVPTDASSARKWPAYFTGVWNTLPAAPDVVLVDGRFRVACALAALLHCPPSTRLVIHDFWDRPHYAPALEFLECIDRIDNIGAFTAKIGLDFRRLAIVLAEHVLDYR